MYRRFHSVILSAVERYIRNVAEDVQDLSSRLNKNGKRLLDHDEHSREQFERANAWHEKTETAIHVISENVSAHDSVSKKQHKNTEDGLHRIRNDLTDHRHEWRTEEKQKQKGTKSLTFIQEWYLIHYEILTSKSDEILRWLSSTDPTINQNAAWESHESQTGKWFVCGKAYLHWKKTPRSFLWIHGIAGCGKTVLS